MKKMPRTHIEGAIYYITSRGDNNEEIFKDSKDYLTYMNALKKYKAQYGFKLFAFCLLPNHMHLLIELKEGITISDIMHDLNSNYTKYFNGRYNRKGHLFQERNRTILAEKLTYLLPMTAYIHLNPKAQNLASEIKDYPYSSCSRFWVLGSGLSVIEGMNLDEEVKEIAGYLKGKTYADFLNSVTKNEMEVLAKDLSKKLMLGSEGFITKVEQIMKESLTQHPAPKTQNPRFIMAGSLAILVLGILTLYLYSNTIGLKENFKKELSGKETELTSRLAKDRKRIYEDLDEKYRADKVSYEAMVKRLEIEKGKVKELENKLR